MKRKDTIKQHREKTEDELVVYINELRGKLEKLQIDKGFNQLSNMHELRSVRKEVARAQTILAEKNRSN